MSLYRDQLPQLSGALFLTDGGLETDLIFNYGAELPQFASYVLLETTEGQAQLGRYFDDYITIATERGAGLLLESATWRASADWAAKIGTSAETLDSANRQAIAMLAAIRRRYHGEITHIVLSGCVGPRSDAYRPTEIMTPEEAERYHAGQIATFAETEADLVTAMTMTNVPEAVGIARAARAAGMPSVISFTVETDGRLPSGLSLREAVEQTDEATGGWPAYYMINCAHPTHFETQLPEGERWTVRLRGLRANASQKSHAELDESTELDEGNPVELAAQYRELVTRHPHINVLGGCCGTDHRHIREIAAACS